MGARSEGEGRKGPSSDRLKACFDFGLRHDGEREIIPIAAFVAGLEIVPVDCNDAAIGQVAKGAADGIS